MSDCNHCKFRAIKARAKEEGKRVVTYGSVHGGTDVFVLPKGVRLSRLGATRTERERYLAAWFMLLTPSCEC